MNTISTAPYTLSTTDDLPGVISLDNCSNSTINVAKLESAIADSIETSIKPKEKEIYDAAKLDNNSNERNRSYITAYVSRKTK
jgi:hypothetical protein